MVTIPGKLFKGLLAFASTDPTRFHLNSLYVTPRYYVATDGHCLVEYQHSTNPDGQGVLVPSRYAKGVGAKDTVTATWEPENDARITTPAGTDVIAHDWATYPTWKQVVPKVVPQGVLEPVQHRINPALLGRMAKVVRKNAGVKYLGTDQRGGDAHLGPQVYTAQDGNNPITFVIMPMRP